MGIPRDPRRARRPEVTSGRAWPCQIRFCASLTTPYRTHRRGGITACFPDGRHRLGTPHSPSSAWLAGGQSRAQPLHSPECPIAKHPSSASPFDRRPCALLSCERDGRCTPTGGRTSCHCPPNTCGNEGNLEHADTPFSASGTQPWPSDRVPRSSASPLGRTDGHGQQERPCRKHEDKLR